MNISQIESALRNLVQAAYGADSSIRYDPFWQDVNQLHRRIVTAMEAQADAEMNEEITAWRATALLRDRLGS